MMWPISPSRGETVCQTCEKALHRDIEILNKLLVEIDELRLSRKLIP
jgi:hypothetical protein